MSESAYGERAGLKPHREMLVPELDEDTLPPEAYVLRRRSGVTSHRALIS